MVLQPRNFQGLIMTLLRAPFALVCRFIPKKSIIVVGARDGQAMDWESKYLYLHLIDHLKEVPFEVYWVTKNKKVYEELKTAEMPVLLLYTWAAIKKVAQARFAVVSASLSDIDGSLISGAKVIQTFHGLPIRRLANSYYAFQVEKASGLRRLMNQGIAWLYRTLNRQKFTYILAPSVEWSPVWEKTFAIAPSQVKVTGMPRDDELYIPSDGDSDYVKPGEKLILYLPTHRSGYGSSYEKIDTLFTNTDFDLAFFDKFLEDQDAHMIVKGHYLHGSLDSLEQLLSHSERIHICTEEDVIPILKASDLLLTDYCNIFHNYLHLDRPMVFAAFDLEEYTEQIGFIVDFESYVPGPVCHDWKTVCQEIKQAWTIDPFSDKRQELKNRVYKYHDGNNCKRIAAWLAKWNQNFDT